MASATEEKLNKLAVEYTKLKSKNAVLKKAVIEHQEKLKVANVAAAEGQAQQEEITKLKKALAERTAQLKKISQQQKPEKDYRETVAELDTLQFQNQQLSKRVQVLQNELETAKRGGSKQSSKSKKKQEQDINDLKDEELMRKIQENASLHTQMAELKERTRTRVEQLEISTKEAFAHRQKAELVLEKTRQESDTQQKATASEIADLKSQVEKLRREVKDVEDSRARIDQQLDQERQKLKVAIQEAEEAVAKRLVFDDIAKHQFNRLNIPCPLENFSSSAANEATASGASLVKDFVVNFSNFFTYLEERIIARHGSENEVYTRLCSALHEHATFIKPLERTFASYASGDSATLIDFCQAATSLVDYLQRLVPLVRENVEEESKAESCTTTLQNSNNAVSKSFENVVGQISTVVNRMTAIISSPATQAELQQLLSELAVMLEQLHGIFRALASQFSSKVALEQRLQGNEMKVDTLEKLKTTDRTITATLSRIVVTASSIAKLVRDNASTTSAGGSITRGVPALPLARTMANEAVENLQAKATKYMALLHREPPPSVPYTEALVSRGSGGATSTQKSSPELQSLQKSLSEARERVAQLEEEREHHMLEAQLNQIKLEKLQAKSSVLANGTNTVTAPDQQAVTLQAPAAAVCEEKSQITLPQDQATREELIKKHFATRIHQLTAQVQFADSKAVTYYEECRALALQIEYAQQNEKNLAVDVKNSKAQLLQMQEEVETTKRNYEEQLAMMTEHVMSLNNQLSTQHDQVAQLKASKSKGGRRK